MSENTEKKRGRPSALTDKVLSDLKQAFSIGATHREACAYADIALSTLQLHMVNDPDFSEQVKNWKQKPVLKARHVVMKAIEKGDKTLAWDYLQKKNRDEFGTRTEITGANGLPISTTKVSQEDARKMADELDEELEG